MKIKIPARNPVMILIIFTIKNYIGNSKSLKILTSLKMNGQTVSNLTRYSEIETILEYCVPLISNKILFVFI